MLRKKLKNFLNAYINILIFIPYFFSVDQLLKTLFSPWKGIVLQRKKRAFELKEIFSVWSFNLISRSIGFTLRIGLLLFYSLIQILIVLFFPLIFLVYLLFLPILVAKDLLFPESEKFKKEKEKFLNSHVLETQNLEKAEEWFNFFYKEHIHKKPWWSLENLFSIPPLAKDWSFSYTVELDSVSEELTSLHYLSKITEIVDREKEIQLLYQYLFEETGGNVFIIGEPGVGKHTLVDALAKNIYENKVSSQLLYKRVLKLNLIKIFSKFDDKTKRKEYFKNLLQETIQAKNIILVIENIHLYLDPNSENNINEELFEFLKSENLHIIGITTTFAYELYIFPQSDLKKLFKELVVKPISKEEALKILLEKFWIYENKYKIILPYETLKAIIELSDDFITEIPFPEKAFKLLEETIFYAVANKIKIITPDIAKNYLQNKLNLPLEITAEFKDKLKNLEKFLKGRIYSQNEAIESISLSLKKAFLNLKGRKKPLASFLFLGPTGVGKTETAKSLAEIFFGSQEKIARIDLGFYQREEDLPKLIGDPRKKIVGKMVKEILELKYGVLLFDELEKAHPKFFNTLLTLLDEGYIIDSSGKKIDCRYLIIIATSNAGYELYSEGRVEKQDLIRYLIEKGIFSPEFLNRFDDIILFNSLPFETILLIAKQKIKKLLEKYEKEYKIKFNISDEEIIKLLKESEWQRFGAREIDRIVLKKIESKIIDQIFS